MGIRISSQPIAAPIIASYATGVGRAQERRADKQLDMMQREDDIKRAEAQRIADRQHDIDMFDRRAKLDDARRKEDFERDKTLLDRRDDMYRDKDATDSLMDEIRKREDFMRTQKLTPEGQRKAKEAQDSLDWLRRARESGYRDDQMRQFYSQWVNQFDSNNPSGWVDTRTQLDDINERGFIVLPDGRMLRPNDPEAIGKGGKLLIPDKNGNKAQEIDLGGKGPGGAKTFNEIYQGDEGREKFNKDYGRTRDAIMNDRASTAKEGETPAAATHDEIMKRMRDEYDLWAKETGGAPQPAPTPGAAPQGVPGDGQQLPVPTSPYQPPTQPLNAGQPGTPVLPQPNAQQVAGGKTPTDAIRTDPRIDDLMMHYGPDGKPVDKFGNPIQYKIDDGVQYYDKEGRPLDSEGYPVKWVRDKDGNFTTERLSDTPTGKASSTTLGAAPGAQPVPQVQPDIDMGQVIDQSRARDPQNAAMYDQAAKIQAKPKGEWTKEDKEFMYKLWMRQQAAGLGMKE